MISHADKLSKACVSIVLVCDFLHILSIIHRHMYMCAFASPAQAVCVPWMGAHNWIAGEDLVISFKSILQCVFGWNVGTCVGVCVCVCVCVYMLWGEFIIYQSLCLVLLWFLTGFNLLHYNVIASLKPVSLCYSVTMTTTICEVIKLIIALGCQQSCMVLKQRQLSRL